MKNIVIFASGNGSNAEELMKASLQGHYKVSAVICDKKDAGVIGRSEKHGVKSILVEKARGETIESHESRILNALEDLSFDLIVLES